MEEIKTVEKLLVEQKTKKTGNACNSQMKIMFGGPQHLTLPAPSILESFIKN